MTLVQTPGHQQGEWGHHFLCLGTVWYDKGTPHSNPQCKPHLSLGVQHDLGYDIIPFLLVWIPNVLSFSFFSHWVLVDGPLLIPTTHIVASITFYTLLDTLALCFAKNPFLFLNDFKATAIS